MAAAAPMCAVHALLGNLEVPWRLDRAAWWRDRTEFCAASHQVALCALQGPCRVSGLLPIFWREPTRLPRGLGSKLDRADAMCCRLRVIRAAAPTAFRYCCTRGIQNPSAAPAEKLQPF